MLYGLVEVLKVLPHLLYSLGISHVACNKSLISFEKNNLQMIMDEISGVQHTMSRHVKPTLFLILGLRKKLGERIHPFLRRPCPHCRRDADEEKVTGVDDLAVWKKNLVVEEKGV